MRNVLRSMIVAAAHAVGASVCWPAVQGGLNPVDNPNCSLIGWSRDSSTVAARATLAPNMAMLLIVQS
jgi:hypothetical protein